MRVHVHPADAGGCGFYRLIWPTRALMAQGADVHLAMPEDPDAQFGCTVNVAAALLHSEIELTGLTQVPECDVVVLQRPLTRQLVDVIAFLQAEGIVVVVEIDDDFSCIHPANHAFPTVHPKLSPHRNHQLLAEACRRADLVTVTTPALARRYGSHGRVAILPNLVPERYLRVVPPPHVEFRIGWAGDVSTHPTDLQRTGGAVGRFCDELGLPFYVVGDGAGVGAAIGVSKLAHSGGFVHIDKYPDALALFDIGVVPLAETAFNQAKSWLKGLEFAAVGVPFVASPTGPYVELTGRGAGVLADKPKDWARELRRLTFDRSWRAEVAGRGRVAASKLTVEANCGRWWDAWEAALHARRARKVAL